MTKQPGHRFRWPTALALAVLLALPAAGTASPLQRSSLWVNHLGDPAALVAQAGRAGVGTVVLKAAEGTTPEPRFTATLVASLRSSGLTVCAWTFVYGVDPAGEAAAAVAAVHQGAACLVVDAEGQYDKRYGAAQRFVRTIRHALGGGFPIALAGQAETFEHPKFPYSVFLGPGGFQVDMPQVYWRDLGLTVPAAMHLAYAQNELYGRAIVPLGQLYGAPAAGEVIQFAALAREYGSGGASFFDLDAAEAEPALLAALAPHPVPAIRLATRAATVRPGADSDAVLWAQELLDGAGARLPVGGFFGAQTGRAVVRFQARHGLRRSGLLDPATWRALLRVRPHVPSWTAAPPESAR